MRKPILAYIPALARNQGVNAAHPISQQLFVRRTSEATRINRDGLIEQVSPELPRQDWEGSNCPSLLLEPERKNYALNNTQLQLNDTTTSGSTITKTGNFAAAPDGTITATRLQASGTSGYALLSVNNTNPTQDDNGGGYYRSSVYVKSNTGSTQTIAFYGQSTQGSKTHEIGNEWKRIDLLAYRPSGPKYTYLGLHINNGSDEELDFLAWGGQTELVNSYPSSLIYTEGSAVTRTKDYATGWSGSWINDADLSEGTFFVDVTPFDSGSQTTIGLSDGSDSNKLVLIFQSYGTQVRVYSSGGVSSFLNLTFDQRNKIAVTFKENEYKFFINGALLGSDTSATIPSGIDRLNLSNRTASTNFFEGKVHDIRVFDYVLSEEEAIRLTN